MEMQKNFESNLAPVIVFAYNRVEHLKQTVEALANNDLADKTDLYIYVDKEEKNAGEDEKNKVIAVYKYVKNIRDLYNFKTVSIVLADTHQGLANSIIKGVSEVIKRHGRVIVLEDDLITAKSFLRFMNGALCYYSDNPKVWSISGYSLVLKSLRTCKADVYACYRGSSWGWATWKNRWNTVDWNVSDYQQFMQNPQMQKQFNKGGSDMTKLLQMQQNGQCNSWAIRFNYQQFKEKMISIVPVKSQIQNLGWDGTGTNCNRAILKIFSTCMGEYLNDIIYADCKINEKIMREFRMAYSPKLLDRIRIVYMRIVYGRD